MSKFVFVSTIPVSGTFSDSAYAKFSIAVDEGCISMHHIAGRCPTFEEFASGVLETVFDEAESIPVASRRNPYRIVKRTGYSGCEDYILEEARGEDVVRHHVLHVSSEGKINEDLKGVYLDDLLQVLTRLPWVSTTNGNKFYVPYYGAYEQFVEMKKLTARDITKEDGWCLPNGELMNGKEVQEFLPNIKETVGGHRVPSIKEGPIGKMWAEAEESYYDNVWDN